MNMDRDFKLRFNEMRDSDLGAKEQEPYRSFSNAANIRNLCFVWPDGKMKFVNYAYLVSVEYSTDGNLVLMFTSDTIYLKGVRLETLFEELMSHIPQRIICSDERYNQINENDKVHVNEILVIKNT